jgi:outer membrane protein assembly factor BamE (lipoprotein component of BamABCDE complex)
LCVALLALAAAAGCTKLTPENYAKIKVGMPYAEVAAILGEPTGCDAVLAIKSCSWSDDARKVSIQFIGDQVVMSSAENLR